MSAVQGFVGDDVFVAVCQGRIQRIFQYGNCLAYSTLKNQACLVRLARIYVKDVRHLAKEVRHDDDLVWLVEGRNQSYSIGVAGSFQCDMLPHYWMSAAEYLEGYQNMQQKCLEYMQGFVRSKDVWKDAMQCVRTEGEYQFGFVQNGKAAVLYNPNVWIRKKCVPPAYYGSWFYPLSEEKQQENAEVYRVLTHRLRAGLSVEDIVKEYVTTRSVC